MGAEHFNRAPCDAEGLCQVSGARSFASMGGAETRALVDDMESAVGLVSARTFLSRYYEIDRLKHLLDGMQALPKPWRPRR